LAGKKQVLPCRLLQDHAPQEAASGAKLKTGGTSHAIGCRFTSDAPQLWAPILHLQRETQGSSQQFSSCFHSHPTGMQENGWKPDADLPHGRP
jgi:hypothetical protein